MKPLLKKLGIVGGTAAACAACCAGPLVFGPLLAWFGVAGVGLFFALVFACISGSRINVYLAAYVQDVQVC